MAENTNAQRMPVQNTPTTASSRVHVNIYLKSGSVIDIVLKSVNFYLGKSEPWFTSKPLPGGPTLEYVEPLEIAAVVILPE
jgi:hypothetical protein